MCCETNHQRASFFKNGFILKQGKIDKMRQS